MDIQEPLASKVRPQKLSDIIGQHHLLDPHRPLRSLIESKKPVSMILYGPPGIGKTTLASVMVKELNLPVETFNAAIDNKAKLTSLVKKHPNETFALILDEIHRLTKPIQDYLLPYLESGHIILLGCTTGNPMITIDPAIRSRCAIFNLKPVDTADMTKAVSKASQEISSNITPEVANNIAKASNGDVRVAINILDTLSKMYPQKITSQQVIDFAHEHNFVFDKNSDFHYDTLSALQKSIRGMDTDAALYYTGILCNSGDLESLIRRLKVICYEDIGLADPQKAQQAAIALLTAKDLGLPEARIPISNAVILMCLSNHSNSAYKALDQAIEDAKNNQQYPIPNHLKDTHYKGSDRLGHRGYKYPHDYPHDWVPQQYLPDKLTDRKYYHPHDNNSEKILGKHYHDLKAMQKQLLKHQSKS